MRHPFSSSMELPSRSLQPRHRALHRTGFLQPTLLGCILSLALGGSVQAHTLHDAGGFGSGFGHPWSGWDHILAMVAVGIWGAQLRAPAIWLLPVAFPLVMAFGGFLGLAGVPLPGVEMGIALSAIALGAAVACEARPPLAVAAVLTGIFGLFHGYAHGTELPPGEDGLRYSLGFVIGTGCLHGVGILLGLVHRWPAGRKTLRVAGAGICLAGLWFAKEAWA